VGAGITQPLPRWARSFLGVNGALITGAALLLFISPGALQQIEPWKFTPLTARTLAGWLIGVGAMQVWMAWEADWSRIKLATTMLIALPGLLLLQLLRYSGEVAWNSAALWALLAATGVTALLLLALWGRASRTPRA
jgi:hypothetical protein